MTKLNVDNVNTMHVRPSYDGSSYLVLGVKSCLCVGIRASRYWGKQAVPEPCAKCSGTGKRTVKRNEKRHGRIVSRWTETVECKRCYWSGTYHNWSKPATCEMCQGSCIVPQNNCDTIPQRFVDALPIRVYRIGTHEHVSDRFIFESRNSLYSCSGSSEHNRLSDDELIAKVRESRSFRYVQACKISGPNGKMVHHIAVLCAPYGYDVRGIMDDCELVPVEETPRWHKRRQAIL